MHMYMNLSSLGLFIKEKEVTSSLPRHIIVWDEEFPIRVLNFYLKCLHKLYDIAQYFAKCILQTAIIFYILSIECFIQFRVCLFF